MLKLFRYIYYKTLLGKTLMVLYHTGIDHLVPEKKIVRSRYKRNFGHYPNLKSPRTLNEKIIWLKLNDRTPLHTQCADKFAVRQFIIDKIGETYLVPLYFQTEDPKQIIAQNLPDTPCIIKTNHDSGGGIFVHDKAKIDYKKAQEALRRRLKRNYYQKSKEWQYKNIVPCIIVELLLQDKNGNIPMDYKLHCFNGKVRMIQVDIGRGTDNHFRNWYDTQWKREPYKWSSPKGNGKFTDPSPEDIPRPKTLEQMIELSEVLSKPFDYVRADWYDVDDKLYFGELTFHHDGGTKPILPKEWDQKLGSELRLSSISNG